MAYVTYVTLQESVDAVAAPWLQPAAEAGNVYAQFLYAAARKSGSYGFEQDEAEAIEYQTRAADRGHALAQHELGMHYWATSHQGGAQSQKRCLELWQAAAEAGLAAAQVSMATCHANGYMGLPKSDAEARRWYERAARQGHAEAALVLRNFP